jgi:hypothetical protein
MGYGRIGMRSSSKAKKAIAALTLDPVRLPPWPGSLRSEGARPDLLR